MKPTLAFASYGHTRHPKYAETPRNSVLLTNFSAFEGCKQVADVTDYSPIVGTEQHGNIQWDKLKEIPEQLKPADVLYCQASVSLETMQRFREIAPEGKIILQRDSTHAKTHHRLMKEGMARNHIQWDHYYDQPGNLERELNEYELADHIFVLSDWVKSTFEEHGLGHKTTHFAPQVCTPELWHPTSIESKSNQLFTVIHVAQLGVRKGTFELLEGFTKFWKQHPNSRLVLCGMPEHGAPPELNKKLDEAVANTPATIRAGWVDMTRMSDAYAQAHVLVVPSWEDGSTCTGPEAGLCGLPIIGTRNAGIDILKDGETGWQIPAGDSDSITGALIDAMTNRTKLSTYSEEIQRRAKTHSNVEAFSNGVAKSIVRSLEQS